MNTESKKLFEQVLKSNPELLPFIHDYLEEDGTQYDKDLVEPRKEYIKNLDHNMITNVRVVGIFDDDGSPCIGGHITFVDGTIISVATHCSPSFMNDWYHWDSPSAKQSLISFLYEEFGVESLTPLTEDQLKESLATKLVEFYSCLEEDEILSVLHRLLTQKLTIEELQQRIIDEGIQD